MAPPLSRPIKAVVRRWEAFWFEEVPPESFALLRIAFGVLGFLSILSLIPVSTFWSIDGLIPVPGSGDFGLKAFLASLGLGTTAAWGLFLGLLVSFAGMVAGYRTAWFVVCCFVGCVVHQKLWNRLPLAGAHHIVLVVLFYLMWADCSGRPSVDAWLAARKGQGRPSAKGQAIWPLRLIRIQIALIYVTTGLWKFSSGTWRDGSALHFVLNMNGFARFPYWLPANLEWITTLGTYLTLFWELSFPLMLLHPLTRRLTLAIGVLMHVGMAVTMELGLFSWVMIASYLAFLDPHSVSKFVAILLKDRRPVESARIANKAAHSLPSA